MRQKHRHGPKKHGHKTRPVPKARRVKPGKKPKNPKKPISMAPAYVYQEPKDDFQFIKRLKPRAVKPLWKKEK